MFNFNGQTITKKQQIIIVAFFLFRGLLFEQFMTILARWDKRELTDTYRQNTYKDLQKLTKLKLLSRDPLQLEGRLKHFMYLTEHGTELAYQILDIPPGHKGTGWDNNYGEFPYELQRPPAKLVHHHLLLTDTLIEVDRLKHQYPDLNIQYRDNRYCSMDYVRDSNEYKFRPDGELRIGDKLYLLEIDRGTEYLEAWKEKFDGYDRNFSWRKEQGMPIPEGVIIISDPKSKNGIRRWTTFLNAFMSKMSNWYLNFNMSFGSVDDLSNIIFREVNTDYDFKEFSSIIHRYAKEDLGTGGVRYLIEQSGIACHNGMRFSVTTTEKKRFVFAYERFEYYESRGIARLFELHNWFQKEKNYQDVAIIPVLYHSDGSIIHPVFNGFSEEDTLNTIFAEPLWLKIVNSEDYYWTNKAGDKLSGNPLLLKKT